MALTEPATSRLSIDPATPPTPSPTLTTLAWRRFRRHRLALLGAVVLGGVVGVCLAGPLVVPESAANRVDPTLFRAPPSLAHPFGSDDVGRDILWRTIYGGRISLAIGALSIALARSEERRVGKECRSRWS